MMMWFGGVVRSEEVYVRKTEYERKGEGAGGGGIRQELGIVSWG